MRTLWLVAIWAIAASWMPRAEAAYAYVNNSKNICTSTHPEICQLGASIPTNGKIDVCATAYAGETFTAVPTDDAGNVYAAVGADAIDTASNSRSNCWYAIQTGSGAPTVTISVSGDTSNFFVYVWGYTGNATGSVLVAANKSDDLASNTSQSCAARSATNAGQLMIGFISTSSGAGSFAPGGTETERGEEPTFHQTQIEDNVSSGAVSMAPSWTLGAARGGTCVMAIFDLPITAPTFTANPAIGTRTTSSIPVVATSACADCTLYVVAVTDNSGAPTAAQIKAGQNSSGSSAYKSCSAAMTANVQAICTLSSYTDGTVRDGYAVMESVANGFGAVYGSGSLVDMYKLPAFSTPLTVASTSASAYTSNSKVLDGAGTVTWARCPVGATAPTVSQVEAGTGGCITDYATDDATGSMVLTIGGSVVAPLSDLYYVGTYGGQHEAAVHALTSQYLTAPTGFQFVTLASVNSVGSLPQTFNSQPFFVVAYSGLSGAFHLGEIVVQSDGAWGVILLDSGSALTVDVRSGTFTAGRTMADQDGGSATVLVTQTAYPPIVAGDVEVIPTTISPSGVSLTSDTAGQLTYFASGQQTGANALVYRVASAAYMTLDVDLSFNNQAPICQPSRDLVVATGSAMTTADLHNYCPDPESDTTSFGRIQGSDPAGLAFTDSTTGTLAGTPTAQNLSGVPMKFITLDAAYAATEQDITVFPATAWPIPNCVGQAVATCESTITSATHGSVNAAITASQCSNSVPIAKVISQNPAAGGTAAPFTTVDLTTSTGSCDLPSCLGATVLLCETRVTEVDATASVSQGTGCTSGSSVIYSQTPALGTPATAGFTISVLCR